MIAWHIGAILFLFRWIFQDPKVDVRFLVVGALLPDLIDIPLGTLVLSDAIGAPESIAHTLLAPTVVTVVILLTTRRGRRRRAWMAMIVAWFLHLLLDGMWTADRVFFWPFLGLEFPAATGDFWGGLVERTFSDPWRWIAEVAGVAYLTWLWRRLDLSRPEVRRRVLERGRLPSETGSPA